MCDRLNVLLMLSGRQYLQIVKHDDINITVIQLTELST